MAAAIPWKQRERRIEFRNKLGEKLVGSLVDTASAKTVILCHGFCDDRETRILQALAAQLDSVPFSSFRFDFSGNGESEGVFEFGNYWKEVEDIRSAVEYLRNQKREIHAVIGHSKAGGDVLLYASRYDDIPFIINIAGRFHMKGGIHERYGSDIFEKLEREEWVEAPRKMPNGQMTTYKLTKKSLDERLSLDMGEEAKKIEQSRVLTIHGSADATIPVADAKAFASCITQHELCVVEEADHNITNDRHLQIVVDRSVRFLS